MPDKFKQLRRPMALELFRLGRHTAVSEQGLELLLLHTVAGIPDGRPPLLEDLFSFENHSPVISM